MDSSIINIPRELISETESFDGSVPISSILDKINKFGAVVITKKEKYLGIIDNRALYRSGLGTGSTKMSASKICINAPSLTDDTSIDEALLGFYKSRTKALPYFSNGKVAGIIKRFTILKALLSLGMLKEIRVSDAMTSPVLAIDSEASLAQAKAAMRDNKVSRLVVIKDKRPYGIITNHDIAYGHFKEGERLPEMKSAPHPEGSANVGGMCNTNLVVLNYTKGLSDAAREMIENNVSSVIVLSSGKPAGIITVFDIFGNIISRRNSSEDNILISGINDKNREYEQEMKDEISKFMSKAKKMRRVKPSAIIVNIKSSGKMYNMHARLSLDGSGTINAHAEEYMLDRCLRKLLDSLTNELKRTKEKTITMSRKEEFRRGIDEVRIDEL
jgi:CBS domain-containing protein